MLRSFPQVPWVPSLTEERRQERSRGGPGQVPIPAPWLAWSSTGGPDPGHGAGLEGKLSKGSCRTMGERVESSVCESPQQRLSARIFPREPGVWET